MAVGVFIPNAHSATITVTAVKMKKKILENKKSICLIIFFSILISILNVISPMLVGTIIDRIVEIEWQEFIKYLLYLGIIYLLIYVLSYLQNKFLSKVRK